jgi:hypothetical protein
MKKFLFSFVIFAISFGAVAQTARAINLGDSMLSNTGNQAGYAAATQTSFAEILGSVVKTALSFVGVIFLILMVYAGYLWMTARGDEGQIEKAETIIRSSIIGIVIATAAYSITAFVLPAILSRTAGTPTSSTPVDQTVPVTDHSGRGTCVYNTGNTIGITSGTTVNETYDTCMARCTTPNATCQWTHNP